MSTCTNGVETVEFEIALIQPELKPASLMRVAPDDEAIDDYSGRLDAMDPIVIYRDAAGNNWLADGAHRVSGAKRVGRDRVKAKVREGTYLDAYREASRANNPDGVRITRADKRRRIRELLADKEACLSLAGGKGEPSNRVVADFCDVSDVLVGQVRKEDSTPSICGSPRVGKDGRVRTPTPLVVGKGQPAAEAPPRKGKTFVNEVEITDPDKIAELRADGNCPEGSDLHITDPGATTSVESVKEEIDERKAADNEVGDEEWLSRLPLSTQLKGVQLATFKDEALVYRRAIAAVKQCGKKVAEEFNKVRRQGPLHWRWTFGFRADDPSKWARCAEPVEGGCGGSGVIEYGSQTRECGQCRGKGYKIIS